jgi:purine-nucleoside phosphorylase
MNLLQKISEAKTYLETFITTPPKAGIILGTGLGGLTSELKNPTIIDYKDIPHMPEPTVMKHEGKLWIAELAEKTVLCFQGRFHTYEGFTQEEITFPVRLIQALGCEYHFISNACGGINPLFKAGDIMCITDHINLLGTTPLIGKNHDELGPRFVDMIEPYDQSLIDITTHSALKNGIQLRQGVYACMAGPCLETRAEYRMLKILGADVIGMSTVPEVIAATHAGLKTLGLSVITDQCLPDALKPINIPDIIKHATTAEPKLIILLKDVLKNL